MYSQTSHLVYNGFRKHWTVTLKAARLVPQHDTSEGISIIDTIPIIIVPGDSIGIPSEPINRLHPSTIVTNGLMVIEPDFMVNRNGVEGLVLCADYTGSSTSVSVTSVGGRNPLAPLDWKRGAEHNPLTDTSWKLGLEWRTMQNGDIWMNHAVHGWDDFGKAVGPDEHFGSPTSLSTMYSPKNGHVRQYVWAPKFIPELGVNTGNLGYSSLHDTYMIAVWFPHDSKSGYKLVSQGFRVDSLLRNVVLTQDGDIYKHIIPNPYGPSFWNRSPAIVYRLFPVTREHLTMMQALHLDSRANQPARIQAP